ncbi:MAG: 30S ribosomal protein S14 [Proteobacteria bacterium]|jgi:small subunit ribosomal protein S14|nr:MAG: 30S ribosomal protein S14 [Pseudomonadota bacterium]
MAKKSAVEKNDRRRKLADQYAERRAKLKAIIKDKSRPLAERMQASMKLAELPRNSSKTRIRNRCEITGRPRGYYRKLRMSRNKLRELASQGLIPGMIKASW